MRYCANRTNNFRVFGNPKWTCVGSFVCFYLIIASLVAAAGLDADSVVIRLQKQYDEIRTIEADFEQETKLSALNQKRTAKGRVYLKKPGRMHWTYEAPTRQEIVSDGKTLWIYLVNEKKCYVYDTNCYLDSEMTMGFLMGRGQFTKDFRVSVEPETSPEYIELKLVPRRTHPHVSEMKLWIQKNTFLIGKIQNRDHFGNVTLLTLHNQKLNRPLEKDLFTFTPPAGAQIIKGTTPKS